MLSELRELGELLVQDMANKLLSNKPHAKKNTGSLIESLEFKIEDGIAETINLNIYGADYAKWVEVGRKKKAKRVPLNVLIKWASEKGLATGDKKLKSLAFAIQTSIWKNGIAPVPFIQFAIDKNENKISEKVLKSRTLYISNEIDKLILKYRFDKELK